MMPLDECKRTMTRFEKNIVGPAVCTISRKLMLIGAASYEMGDTLISLLGSRSSTISGDTTVGKMRGLPFLPKDYFHPLSKKLLFNLLKHMVTE
jgi:hypothetical protein